MTSKSAAVLARFTKYCQEHPEERFWQALRNWSGYGFIVATDTKPETGGDTFYWEEDENAR